MSVHIEPLISFIAAPRVLGSMKATTIVTRGVLERLGWQFIRIRGSAYFRNPELAMRPVFDRLSELQIPPEANVDQAPASDMTLIHELDELIRKGFGVDDLGNTTIGPSSQVVDFETGIFTAGTVVVQHVPVNPQDVHPANGHEATPSWLAPTANAGPLHTSQRAANTRLLVRFQDGAVICETKAANTFALALKEFGLDRVRDLGKFLNGIPLISAQRHAAYTQYQFGQDYVMTHSSTKSKKEILENVAKELGVQVSVEIIS